MTVSVEELVSRVESLRLGKENLKQSWELLYQVQEKMLNPDLSDKGRLEELNQISMSLEKTVNELREKRIKELSYPLLVKEMEQVQIAEPAVWRGVTEEGDLITVRFRWGMLSVDVWGRVIDIKEVRKEPGGTIDWAEMHKETRNLLHIPFEVENK